ncbi:MAG: IS110 family transposase [Longimicrobiaceae bacterium]
MKRNRWKKGTPRPNISLLERINPDVAGIDCGSAEHFVAVPVGRDPDPVQSFGTFTGDLNRLADWLEACGVRSVAMEATGVYWIPLYEILEARGFKVLLVNARHVKNVAGRKSDVLDCEWLRELHSVGLLRASFRPTEAITALRGYIRHRDTLVQTMSSTIQRMQKALVQMNVQLPQVITDITGTTGLAILHDIVAGRTDPQQLVLHRDPRCHASAEQFVTALTGNYRPEHVFVLKQNLALFEYYQAMLSECDAAIEGHLQTLAAQMEPPTTPLPPRRTKPQSHGKEPRFDIRGYLYHLTGTDLSQIDGIGPYQALRLISEIGTDMRRWPTDQHFTAWLTLAPQNKISGGRLLSSRTPASANRAAAMLRMVAMSLARTQTALGAFYRRLAARIGKAKAITATARKVAILVYRALKGEIQYEDPGPDAYNARQRNRLVRGLRKRAQALGFTLVAIDTGELLPAGVS